MTEEARDADRSAERSQPKYPWHRICFYSFFRFVSRVVAVVLWDIRVTGLKKLPKEPRAIVAPNHVSFLDPWLVGVAMPPIVSYMARESLFQIPIFGGFLRNLNALPVVRGSNAARQGLKTGLNALKDNRILVVFPEGTRSADGELQPLKRGILLLARQGGCPIVPVYCQGTFEAWPRQRLLPRIGSVTIRVGDSLVARRGEPRNDEAVDSEIRRSGVQDSGNSSENKDGKDGDLQRLVENGWAQALADARPRTLSGDIAEDAEVTADSITEVREDVSAESSAVPVTSPEQDKKLDKQSGAAFLESLVQSYRTLQEEVRESCR